MNLTNEDVVEILRLLDESPYDELNLDTDAFSLRLRRTGDGGWAQEAADKPRRDAAPDLDLTSDADAPAEESGETVPPPPEAGEGGLYDLYPPLPGTFYRAPKPGADPFVSEGSRVEEDTTVGIVETMKLMNSVPAGVTGEIVRILAENGKMVEPGEVLMQIRLDES